MGKKGPDTAPKVKMRTWEDRNGIKHQVPVGIDPGFDTNMGKAAWGAKLSESAMEGWTKQGGAAWERLSDGDFNTYHRPAGIQMDKPAAKPDYTIKPDRHLLESKIESVIGGKEKVFMFAQNGMEFPILVNAATLAQHVDPGRISMIPLLKETLEDPYEVWMSFEKHKGTGRVVLRQRIIKGIELKKGAGMLVITNAVGGVMEAWTVIPVKQLNYLNNQRAGKLIWKRD